MDGFYFTLEEFQALSGSSLLASRVYLTLRRYMDEKSMTVGKYSRPISYQFLMEEAERWIPKRFGTQIIKPTMKEMRVAIQSLKRAGLIVGLSGDGLEYSLPLARLGQEAANDTGGAA